MYHFKCIIIMLLKSQKQFSLRICIASHLLMLFFLLLLHFVRKATTTISSIHKITDRVMYRAVNLPMKLFFLLLLDGITDVSGSVVFKNKNE